MHLFTSCFYQMFWDIKDCIVGFVRVKGDQTRRFPGTGLLQTQHSYLLDERVGNYARHWGQSPVLLCLFLLLSPDPLTLKVSSECYIGI